MKLDKRGRSRALLLGGLLLAYFLTTLFVSTPHIAFLLQFLIALIGVSLLITYALQAFSLTKWKRMLALSLLIISALTWYIYPVLSYDKTYFDKVARDVRNVQSYEELIHSSDRIVIGRYGDLTGIITSHGHPYHPLRERILSRTHMIPTLYRLDLSYSFIVDEYLLGWGSHSVQIPTTYIYGDKTVEQIWVYWTINHSSSVPVPLPSTDLLIGSIVPTFIEPTPDETVVLFLGYGRSLFPRVEPFMFSLLGDRLYVRSNLPDVIEAFPPITLAELTEMIGD